MSIGEQIRLARQRAGMSQQQLGDAARVSKGLIGNYEVGRTEPSQPTIDKLESVLGPLSDTPPQDIPEAEGTTMPDDDGPRDAAPKPRKAAGAKKSSGSPRGKFTLADQLELPYKLGANLVGPRLPNTARVLEAQARPCAEAWDQFLYRYPALREKIEQGMIASDIIALLMAHAPIFQMAVAETRVLQQQAAEREQGTFDGGIGAAA